MAALADYRARLAIEPLTLKQLGAIHREFARLGFDHLADRDERLDVTAELAGIDWELSSTKELTMGEAGRVVGALRECRGLPDLNMRLAPARVVRGSRSLGEVLADWWHGR